MHTWIYKSQNLTLGGIIIKKEEQKVKRGRRKERSEIKEKKRNDGLMML